MTQAARDRHAVPARNAACPCGSGEKYKRCCGSLAGQANAPGAPGEAAATQTSQQQFQRGVQLLRSGQIEPAMAALIGAIKADASHFGAYHALGAALMQSGRPEQASAILSQAVALRPDSAVAHRDLGGAYDAQNLHEAAIASYRRSVELSPKQLEVQLRLSQLYAMYSRREEAGECLDRAAEAKPDSTLACLYRSDAQLMRGDIPGAETWARKAIAMEPANDAAHGTLGGILYAQGLFEEAAGSFETALKLNPNAAKCWEGLVRCRTYGAADTAILGRMEGVLRRREIGDQEATTIHFALGKIHDDRGEYARAMEQFDAGNRLRARGLNFDRAGLSAMVDANIARFTPEFFAGHAHLSTQDARPLFIVGMYRSGTTLTEQILSSHPAIAAGGELTVWAPGDIEMDGSGDEPSAARIRQAVAKYLAVLNAIAPSAQRVLDKLPTNFFRLGAIHTLLPKALIIHCQRDAIDTCLSIYTTYFSSRVPYAARKADLVFCYRQYLRMMDHWRQVLPAASFTEVHYEHLITDREAQTRRLIEFAGLAWDEQCLRPEQNRRAISTSSAWQARQPVYTSSLQRWRRYEPWLGELRELAE